MSGNLEQNPSRLVFAPGVPGVVAAAPHQRWTGFMISSLSRADVSQANSDGLKTSGAGLSHFTDLRIRGFAGWGVNEDGDGENDCMLFTQVICSDNRKGNWNNLGQRFPAIQCKYDQCHSFRPGGTRPLPLGQTAVGWVVGHYLNLYDHCRNEGRVALGDDMVIWGSGNAIDQPYFEQGANRVRFALGSRYNVFDQRTGPFARANIRYDSPNEQNYNDVKQGL